MFTYDTKKPSWLPQFENVWCVLWQRVELMPCLGHNFAGPMLPPRQNAGYLIGSCLSVLMLAFMLKIILACSLLCPQGRSERSLFSQLSPKCNFKIFFLLNCLLFYGCLLTARWVHIGHVLVLEGDPPRGS